MDEKELVFTEILGCDRAQLYLSRKRRLGEENGARIAQALSRRMRGEPLAYILGTTEFMGLEFEVTPEVLVPRQDTEILVETVLRYVTRSPGHRVTSLRILEIGTGSGCIAVSLAKFLPGSRITATDISAGALAIARRNAEKNGVSGQIDFVLCDIFPADNPARETFDLIVSNPPYIPSAVIATLEPEVRAEPRLALDGGADGMAFYRRILGTARQRVSGEGFLLMELGYDQKESLEKLCARHKGFLVREWVKDYNGIDRVAVMGSRERGNG
jgi:release factor glutamine methyltransferase